MAIPVSMSKPFFSPDKRNPQPRRMYEGDLDRQIVRFVHDYRLLSQGQIERLVGKSKSQTQRLLRRLYDHHYLERIFLPVSYFGAAPTLYILDRRGQECLQKQGIEDFSTQPKKSVSVYFLEHTLAINNFRISVTQAAAKSGFVIKRWLTESELKADYDKVHLQYAKQPISLIPDSFFTIEVPNKGATHFFLELDRATMRQNRFKQKIQAYIAYYRSGDYTKRYQAKGFRVLTVIDASDQRRQNLKKTTESVPGIGRRFWFTTLEKATADNPLITPLWSIASGADRMALLE